TAAVSSLAVVLPMEPVMATIGTENFARCHAANRPSERVVSSTSTSGTWAGGSSGSAWTTTHAAPRAAASPRKAWPFSRWPTLALAPDPRDAGGDLRDDRVRILGARVVRRDPRAVGQAGGDLAHDRPLRPVAVAATAEDDAEPPGRDLARRRQHPLQRVGGMG